jgi:hypothetical protein
VIAFMLLVSMQAQSPEVAPEMHEAPVTQIIPSCPAGYDLWRKMEPICPSFNAVPAVYVSPSAMDEKVDPKEFTAQKPTEYVCRKTGYVATPKYCDHGGK